MTSSFRGVLMGPPGSGKGTQCSRLLNFFGIKSLSSGDILRAQVTRQTPLGLKAKAYMDKGELVPDELLVGLIFNEVNELSLHTNRWIMDGFPRTISQAKRWEEWLKEHHCGLDTVIELDVSAETILGRITNRWVHPGSGRTYNMTYNPPKRQFYDDVTGEPLERRSDDNLKTHTSRMEKYFAETIPLKQYYREKGLLKSFKGETSDEIWKELRVFLRDELKVPELVDSTSGRAVK